MDSLDNVEEMENMDNMEGNPEEVEYDEDGNPIPKNKEEEEPEDPIPESVNPLKPDQIRKYLLNLTKTFSGMSFAFTTFNCSEKEIDQLCPELGNFIHLRDVNISKNKISLISGFNNMTHLFRFDARENEIRDMNVFSDPDKFKFLQLLYLSNNKIKILPALYCDNLLELHLDNNNIKNASGFVSGLKKVRFINLSNNKLKDCSGISNCPELVTLKINENEVSSFKGMENLPKLTTLEMITNKFENFSVVPNLDSLVKINVSGNLISDIKEFGKLKFPQISEIYNTDNPATNESGGGTKIEMLILFEGYDIKIVNEEEVVKEDIKEAMEKKEERIKQAEEERIQKEKEDEERREQERIEREAKEEEDRQERLRLEEEERIRKEEEEEERLKQEMENMEKMEGDGEDMDDNVNMGDDDMEMNEDQEDN